MVDLEGTFLLEFFSIQFYFRKIDAIGKIVWRSAPLENPGSAIGFTLDFPSVGLWLSIYVISLQFSYMHWFRSFFRFISYRKIGTFLHAKRSSNFCVYADSLVHVGLLDIPWVRVLQPRKNSYDKKLFRTKRRHTIARVIRKHYSRKPTTPLADHTDFTLNKSEHVQGFPVQWGQSLTSSNMSGTWLPKRVEAGLGGVPVWRCSMHRGQWSHGNPLG